jgi:seryl-tRNA synthetase
MKKIMTRQQAETSKERAVRFVLNVLDDPDRADDIEDESLEEWAERKKITLTNPARRKSPAIREREDNMPKGETKTELLERISELEEENQELNDQLDEVTDKLEDVLDVVAPDEADSEEDAEEDGGDDDEGEE